MTHFDTMATQWDTDPKRMERSYAAFEQIRKWVHFTPAMQCLESGCGTGVVSSLIAPFVGHIDLYDLSQGMIEVATEKIEKSGIPNMSPHLGDICTDPVIKSKQFDLIYMVMALHHVADIEGYLTCVHSMMNKGGHFCIADLVEEDGSFHGHLDNFDGHNGFDTEKLAAIMRKAGFSSVKSELYYTITKKTGTGEERSYPLFMMVGSR